MFDSRPSSHVGKQSGKPELLPVELRQQLLASFNEPILELVAICRLPGLEVVHLNDIAYVRFNPGNTRDISKLNLLDIIDLASQNTLQAEIIPQVEVLGFWSGGFHLRDSRGSELPVMAAFKLQAQARGEKYLCLHAQEQTVAGKTRETHFTDRHLLHALLNHSPDSIYFKDSASRFLRISRALATKLGLKDPSDAIGKTDFDFFDIQHAAATYANEQAIIRTGQPVIDLEETEMWGGGRMTWCSSTKLPLRDEDGRVIGTFGISRDITSRKEAEDSRHKMELQLQLAQKLESIGRLAAGVAHEINTPTQYIADNTRFLVDASTKLGELVRTYRELQSAAAGSPACHAAAAAAAAVEKKIELDYLTGEIPRCLQQSLEGLARVGRIVSSLKEFAHPNSPELTPADLNRVIETALVVSRHEWKYVAKVVTELASDLPMVPCVVDEFNQVMLNLIVNAAHAIGDALKLRGGDQGRITVRTLHRPPWAVVEVEDSGTGIPENLRDRIFEPFFTTKGVGKGTGQGLSIVHTVVVKHHRGTIELASEMGRGTKFILHLPLIAAPAPAPGGP